MRLKALVTVETALIMPLVLVVIFFILSMGFYQHDVAVLIEQSYASARYQNIYESKNLPSSNEISKSCMAAVNISRGIEDNLIKTSVASKGNIRFLFLNKVLAINERQNYVKCYAPEMIRLINMGTQIKDVITDGK